MNAAGLVHVSIVRIPAQGTGAFNEYESEVLPLLAAHGGVLQRRLRSEDGGTEVHLVWFPSALQFDQYRNDPRRAASTPLLLESQATTELLRMFDVT